MVGVIALACCVSAACSEVDAPGTTAGQSPAEHASAAAPATAEPQTVADIFPAGAGRDAVLNSCGSCHNVGCAAIGQRSAERWDALMEGHKDMVPGTDLSAIFAYLKTHFDSTKPEPRVPPRFLEGGCTPF